MLHKLTSVILEVYYLEQLASSFLYNKNVDLYKSTKFLMKRKKHCLKHIQDKKLNQNSPKVKEMYEMCRNVIFIQ